MTDKEQTQKLADEVDKLIEHFRAEYDLSYASVIGVLHMKIHLLCDESKERTDEL